MRKINCISILIILLVYNAFIEAQNDKHVVEHFLTLKTQFFQIEEGANYGLVFDGLNLAVDYDLIIRNANSIFQYSPELGFGACFNKGVGLNWRLKPVNLFYGINVYKSEERNIFLGPYLETTYNLQLYPELQSGHHSWFTFIDLGPRIIFDVVLFDIPFNISFANSIAGFASRPEVNPQSESHFYSLNFFDWLSDMNSNFEFGSSNFLNHINLEIELPDFLKEGLSLEYSFEYYGYLKKPNLNYISHGINLKWFLGRNKEEE